MATVWMFSGQGSQYLQMGRALLESEPVFREHLEALDLLAQQQLGESVLKHLYQTGGSKAFDQTRFTHPAIVMVEYALARLLLSKGAQVDYLLGASLGEVTAAAVADALSVKECMRFVCQQALAFERCCPPGGMIAILAEPSLFEHAPELHRHSELVGVNFRQHFVVAADAVQLEEIEAFLTRRGTAYQRLPVRVAFHSAHIEPTREELVRLGAELNWRTPKYPLISCHQTQPVQHWRPDHFWEVVRGPVQFAATLARLEASGPHQYVDLGPSGTLSNFVQYGIKAADSRSVAHSLMTPFGNDRQKLQTFLEHSRPSAIHQPADNRKGNNVNTQPVAWMFPGQGSQFKGMGKGLFEKYPQLVQQADEILGYSIARLCLEDPEHNLANTRYTQPALYVVNCLSFLEQKKQVGQVANHFLGHSLGEYNALFAAGAFDFVTGLKLVMERGRLMSEVRGGGMAAVINLSEEKLRSLLSEPAFSGVDIANLNAPGQIVISGAESAITELTPWVEQEAGAMIPLNVSAPFHSRYMKKVGEAFAQFVDAVAFQPLQGQVIANVTARPYPTDTRALAALLTQQIAHSVRWIESVDYLRQHGVDQFIEIGPGHVLTSLVDKIKRSMPLRAAQPASKQATRATQPVADCAGLTAHDLGAASFRETYQVKSAYVAGAMYKGIASKDLVVRMAKSGYLAFFGAGGIRLSELEQHILAIKAELCEGQTFGMNLLCDTGNPQKEMDTVSLYLKHHVRVVEAAAFMQITPALVLYRAKGIGEDAQGNLVTHHRIIAKISRPEVARAFLSPAPAALVESLRQQELITPLQARLVQQVPVASELCVESDSGGHTDMGVMTTLLPSILRLRDSMVQQHGYRQQVLVGAAGGIGTPEAAASAFMLGADFIVTGSINQCSVEAGTSDAVKEMLQSMDVQDTDYAPAGDMFELGARVQVVKRGVFFPARANKLYELWRNSSSLEAIDPQTRTQIEKNYFKRSFEEVYAETKAHYLETAPALIDKAESNPKFKMALIFRWYFIHSTRMAIKGELSEKVNFQIHCGPAMGAFNQWVKGTALEHWRHRHVDKIADTLMEGTAVFLREKLAKFAVLTTQRDHSSESHA